MTATLTSLTRRVGRRPRAQRKPRPVPQVEPPKEQSPHFWNAYLASSISSHLAGRQSPDQLALNFQEFLDSSACSDTLREMLEPTKGTQ